MDQHNKLLRLKIIQTSENIVLIRLYYGISKDDGTH